MRQITTEELQKMEVINLCDGGRLGYPSGVELCVEDGRVSALIVPCDKGFSFFGKREAYRIPWCRVECIGEDAVLVKLTAADLAASVVKGHGKL